MRNEIFIIVGAGIALVAFRKKLFSGQINNTFDQPKPSKEEIAKQFPVKPSTKFNPLVKRMQQALINFGGIPKVHIQNNGGADGFFGDGTRRALEAFGVSGIAVNAIDYADVLKKGGLL